MTRKTNDVYSRCEIIRYTYLECAEEEEQEEKTRIQEDIGVYTITDIGKRRNGKTG